MGMSNQIQQLPNGSSFGLNFDYSVWGPNSQIILANVAWDASYRDVVWYDSPMSLWTELAGKGPKVHMGGLTYCAPGVPVRINLPFGQVNNYNYIAVANGAQPVPGGDKQNLFFYFIRSVDYVAPNTTAITLMLDVWQTYIHSIEMGRCYIERGHLGIAAENATPDKGARFLSVPEGFDTGGEYMNGKMLTKHLDDIGETGKAGGISGYSAIIASTILLQGEHGDTDNPKLESSDGCLAEWIPNGVSLYVMASSDVTGLFNELRTKPWISQGIVSVTIVPASAINQAIVEKNGKLEGFRNYIFPLTNDDSQINVIREGIVLHRGFRDMLKANVTAISNGRYTHLKKFQVWPYSALELTTYTGTGLILRPETIMSDDLSVTQISHVVPPNPRIAFTVENLNSMYSFEGKEYQDKRYKFGDASYTYVNAGQDGDFMDRAFGIMNLPTVAVTNNAGALWSASNAHSISYQHSAADWSQQRALRAADTAWNNNWSARQNMIGVNNLERATNTQLTNIANNATHDQAGMAGLSSILQGGMSSLAGGSIANLANGAIQGFTGLGMQVSQAGANSEATNARNLLSRDITQANVDMNLAQSDNNRSLAQFAAQGDYSNALAGINAKVQDAQLLPPSTSGQMGGDAFMFAANQAWKIYVKTKVVGPGAMRTIGEYWLRYGYALNQFVELPSNYQCMSKFTFWKLKETTVTSTSCPETFRQTIRGIFEKGVTVWNDESYIGNTDLADNNPIGGFRL